MTIIEEKFDKFNVYKNQEMHQFCYITLKEDSFYDDFARYLLDFSMLKKHATINLGSPEDLTIDDYNEIYLRLISFVDYEKIYDVAGLDQSIVDVLDSELIKESSNLRKDKWGKIGEYIFNVILDAYFNLDCIVRKFALNTSPNVSAFGIDTVHCSLSDKTFFFGESKMVDNIEGGIKLICKSLENYESQISKEYFTIKNNNINKNEKFVDVFKMTLKKCLTFSDLIEKLSLEKIGVPVFIAHGGKYETVEVFQKLKKVPQKSFFNLETIYYLISLPIIDKNKFRESFVSVIRDKIEECKECINAI